VTAAAVRARAARFTDRLALSRAPVDLDTVARAIGLAVVREPLDRDVAGVLLLTPAGPAVCINARQPPERQRRLLAHHIGHVQLGHRFGGRLVHVDRRIEAYREARRYTPDERLEYEANVFAGSVLVPARLLRETVAERGAGPLTDDDIVRLATRFDVSVQGMTLRLVNAGML
jgi:Zn-dependent peptidase ImmA (M78 family)